MEGFGQVAVTRWFVWVGSSAEQLQGFRFGCGGEGHVGDAVLLDPIGHLCCQKVVEGHFAPIGQVCSFSRTQDLL